MNISKFKIILILLTLTFTSGLFAQSSSSYSRFGIGDVIYSYSTRSSAMGGLAVGFSSVDYLNPINPAVLSDIEHTRFEIGESMNGLFLSDSKLSKFYIEGEFRGFTFAFPISQKLGISAALGFLPYTRVSYKVSQNYDSSASLPFPYKINYEGTGGLSKVFFGTSYRLPLGINVGATFDYYMGSINYKSQVVFGNQTNLTAAYERIFQPKGLGSTIGILLPDAAPFLNINSLTNFKVGISLNYISKLRTDTLLTSFSSLSSDTIGSGQVDMKIPFRLSAGISLTFDSKYTFLLDYAYQPWANYELNKIKSAYLRNAQKISSGFEYRPKRELGTSFWEQIIWRAGLSFEKTQYLINGVGIDEYSVSAGFSMPLSYLSTFDFALQYAARGTKDSQLLKENIIRANFGVSLGEIWFIRSEK